MSTDMTTLLIFVLLAICATEPWRHLGVLFAGRVPINGAVLVWVRAVSTALIAALVVRLIINPAGPLAESTLNERAAALAIAVIIYYSAKRNLLLAIMTGAVALVMMSGMTA